MKKVISLVIAIITSVSSAIAAPQVVADTTQVAKQAKKALKLMKKDNEKDWQKGFAMYRDAAYKGLRSAQRELVYFYMSQTPRAEDDAIEFATMLADEGEVEYQYLVGYYYTIVDSAATAPRNAVLGAHYLKIAADNGSVKASALYGMCLIEGRGCISDFDAAEHYFLIAANKDDDAAMEMLGEMYYFEKYGRVNLEKCFKYTMMAAERGNGDAIFNIGCLYMNGEGVTKNLDEAIYWFTKSSGLGNAGAKNNLALVMEEKNGKSDDALFLLRKSADEGDAMAQYNLGISYLSGDGVIKNEEKAFSLFRKSAEQGCAEGQRELGRAYLDGIGTTADSALGLKWLEKAVLQNDSTACVYLASCYFSGNGTDKDDDMGFVYVKKAADMGSALGLYAMGSSYLSGLGVAKSEETGFRYIKQAADMCNIAACEELIYLYLSGIGTMKNANLAINYGKRALELGSENKGAIYYNISFAYGDADKKTRNEYLRKSAELGFPDALINYGLYLFYGDGMPKNEKKAKEYFRKCAQQSDNPEASAEAKEIMKEIWNK